MLKKKEFNCYKTKIKKHRRVTFEQMGPRAANVRREGTD